MEGVTIVAKLNHKRSGIALGKSRRERFVTFLFFFDGNWKGPAAEGTVCKATITGEQGVGVHADTGRVLLPGTFSSR